MGSRLKGKKNKKQQAPDTPWVKLAVYAVIILSCLGVLWYFWLSDRGWSIAKEHKEKSPATAGRGGP